MLQDVTQLQAVRVGDEHRRQERIGYAGVTKKHDNGSVPKPIRPFDFDANAKDAQATSAQRIRPPALQREVPIEKALPARAHPHAAGQPQEEAGDDAEDFAGEIEREEQDAARHDPHPTAREIDHCAGDEQKRKPRQQDEPDQNTAGDRQHTTGPYLDEGSDAVGLIAHFQSLDLI